MKMVVNISLMELFALFALVAGKGLRQPLTTVIADAVVGNSTDGSSGVMEVASTCSAAPDNGVAGTSGCDSVLEFPTASCCKAFRYIFDQECLIEFYGMLGQAPGLDLLLDALDANHESCGSATGYGFLYEEYCGNGVMDYWERCDDGNFVADDGCTDCFIDDGYTCYSPNDDVSSPSECVVCEEECASVHRFPCITDGGACGDCIDGYQDRDGDCGRVLNVHYTTVDVARAEDTLGRQCSFAYIGDIVQPELFPNPDEYIAMVREWQEPSTYGDFTLSTGSPLLSGDESLATGCSLEEALRLANATADDTDIFVIELVVDVAELGPTRVRYFSAVVFSEMTPPATVVSKREAMFEVYLTRKLFLKGITISGTGAMEGGAVRSVGTVVMDQVTVTNGTNAISGGVLPYCDGALVLNYGALALRNVTFSNNFWQEQDKSYCLDMQGDGLVVSSGALEANNVIFRENLAHLSVLSIVKLSRIGVSLENIFFYDNVCTEGSLFRSDFSVTISGVVMKNNTGAEGSLLLLQSPTTVSDFLFEDNIVTDSAGAVSAYGRLTLRDGIARGNTHGSLETSDGGVVQNRSGMIMMNCTFENNTIGAVVSTSPLEIIDSTFVSNVATTYLHVLNSHELLIEGSTFLVGNIGETTDRRSVKSDRSFVARSTFFEDREALRVAGCEDTVWYSTTLVSPCSTTAVCGMEGDYGVFCSCASGRVGDPEILCASRIALDFMPEETITRFLEKSPFEPVVIEETVMLVPSGIGMISWDVGLDFLPTWLSVSPINGTYASDELCSLRPTELAVQIDLSDITTSNSTHVASIPFYTTSVVDATFAYEEMNLTVGIFVEVFPDGATSSMIYSKCLTCSPEDCLAGASRCLVTSGSNVDVHVTLRDVTGLYMGVGGDNIAVRVFADRDLDGSADESSSTSSSGLCVVTITDHVDGTYDASFEAPDMSFVVVAEVNGIAIQGSPLLYDVSCRDGTEWDEFARECVGSSLSFPRRVIALCMIGSLLCGVACIHVRKKLRIRPGELLSNYNTEPVKVYMSMLLDVLDGLTDLGSWLTVLHDPDLEKYHLLYTVVFSVAAVACVLSIFVLARQLRIVTAPAVRQSETFLVTPIRSACTQFNKLSTVEAVEDVVQQLHRANQRSVVKMAVLLFEDAPMQVMNVAVLTTSRDGSAPVAVVIGLIVSNVLIGLKLAGFFGFVRDRHSIARLENRVSMSTMSTMSTRSSFASNRGSLVSTRGSQESVHNLSTHGRSAHGISGDVPAHVAHVGCGLPGQRRPSARASDAIVPKNMIKEPEEIEPSRRKEGE
eukprot:Rmarinus@m.19229